MTHYFTKPTNAIDARALPASVADLKSHLRIEYSDLDAMLAQKLKSATEEVETYIEASIIWRDWTATLDAWPTVDTDGTTDIVLPNPPVQSVTAIKYQDADDVEQTLSGSDYRLSTKAGNAVISPTSSWPTVYEASGVITVQYIAGFAQSYPQVPPALREAIILRAATRFSIATETGIGGSMWSIDQEMGLSGLLAPYANWRV